MDGVLGLNKPRGVSSQQAVTRVKRAVGAQKAGHAGTLDPEATGLLITCLGRATRLFDSMQTLEKEYVAAVTLGVSTDSYDATGKVVAEAAVAPIGDEQLDRVLDGFRGTIEQVPPPFSALKHRGRPLYKWARDGILVEKPPRTVTIYALDVVGLRSGPDTEWGEPGLGATAVVKEIQLRVVCSRGTYIRSLAHDLGQHLGCGAHMSALHRTRTGPFQVEDAMTLEDVEADPDTAARRVLPLDEAKEEIARGRPDTPLEEGSADAGRSIDSRGRP